MILSAPSGPALPAWSFPSRAASVMLVALLLAATAAGAWGVSESGAAQGLIVQYNGPSTWGRWYISGIATLIAVQTAAHRVAARRASSTTPRRDRARRRLLERANRARDDHASGSPGGGGRSDGRDHPRAHSTARSDSAQCGSRRADARIRDGVERGDAPYPG